MTCKDCKYDTSSFITRSFIILVLVTLLAIFFVNLLIAWQETEELATAICLEKGYDEYVSYNNGVLKCRYVEEDNYDGIVVKGEG